MAMTFVILVLWLSADSTQISNDLLLQCACVNRVTVCAFAFSAMDALIWYQFCVHCTMFAFLDWVCQGIVIWHTLYCTFAAVEYNPQFDTIVRQTPVLCAMALNLTCMMHPHETHLFTHFWLLPQNGRQVNAWIVYCACHARQRHAEHAIRSAMISRMCSCSFMAMTFVVLALWLSADSTQISNDLLLQCACVNRVAACAFAFSAMDASIWYQFCVHCTMFAFLDRVCQGIVIWHTLYCTFAAVEYKP